MQTSQHSSRKKKDTTLACRLLNDVIAHWLNETGLKVYGDTDILQKGKPINVRTLTRLMNPKVNRIVSCRNYSTRQVGRRTTICLAYLNIVLTT